VKRVIHLIKKDLIVDWRQQNPITGILLYLASTIFATYMAFGGFISIEVWNALFWIILLFAAINALSRSFLQETGSRQLYYFSIVSPQAIILAKICYNSFIMLLLSSTAFLVYNLIFSNEVGHWGIYMLSILLGSISFATVFTMVAGISAKAGNNSTIMAILSFPVIIPLLIVLINLSQQGVIGGNFEASWKDISVLLAINVVTIAISLLLFPYLWRD